MRLRIYTLAVSALLLFAAPAAKASLPFTAEAEHTYELAVKLMGGPPAGCSSLEKGLIGEGEPWPDGAPTTARLGWANIAPTDGRQEPCHVFLRADMPPYKTCRVMIHEVGHLKGLPHSGDSTSIMWRSYAGYTGPIVPPCLTARLTFLLSRQNARCQSFVRPTRRQHCWAIASHFAELIPVALAQTEPPA